MEVSLLAFLAEISIERICDLPIGVGTNDKLLLLLVQHLEHISALKDFHCYPLSTLPVVEDCNRDLQLVTSNKSSWKREPRVSVLAGSDRLFGKSIFAFVGINVHRDNKL